MDTTNSKRYTIQAVTVVTIVGTEQTSYVCSESGSGNFIGSSSSLDGIKVLCWELGINKDEVEFK